MAAVAYPRWVTFEHYCTTEVDGCSSSIADTNTLACARTSTGHPINVALCLAAPPEQSRVCVQLPAGGVEVITYNGTVLAAHRDSVFVEVEIEIKSSGDIFATRTKAVDLFVYSAGDAAAEPPRPPSLSMLAPRTFTAEENERRPGCTNYLNSAGTGILCRGGDGDFLVAELKVEYVRYPRSQDNKVPKDAMLHLLRSGSGEWRVKQPVIRRYADGSEFTVDLASSWQNNVVIPVGDQMLCWVDLYQAQGLLFSDDVFDDDESPCLLRYVPLPEAPYLGKAGCRNVCATADGSMIKFVNVFPRCCCGGMGMSDCRASHHAYTVHTWMLRMDDMTWTMDGSLDATQIWAIDGYKGIPRVGLSSPVVCMDEPDAICFVVFKKLHDKHCNDKTMWRIMIDMKSKTLRSVLRYEDGWRSWNPHLPSMVSRYFNSKPSTGQPPGPPAAQAEAMLNLTNTRNMLAASPESAILAALQEIPGLDRDDMLKAYRILTHDDSGRRFRSLMGLPMDMRKDCVLMEIKASEACILCSACSADLQ